MEIFVNGKKLNLTQRDYVTKGGEGSIFRKGDVAFKIYEDLRKMIPPAKIGELALLNKPNIIRPKDLIYNEKKHEIGFTMDWLGDDVIALCKLFTNTFRDANGIEIDHTIELVENIKNIIHFIHKNKCLIVDGNELNYMVANDFVTPYFIDVNSWQTPSYQATAIMPSIRDWTTDKFTEVSDWFSFAIVSFQLFVGIHPFKGKHKNYKNGDFRKRIIDCISVFNHNVSIPPTARDFNLIPSSYKDWYFKLFENGQRTPPPHLPGEVGQVQVHVHLIKSTDNFNIRELREFLGDILYHNSQFEVTKTKAKLFIGRTDYKIPNDAEVVFTPLEGHPILVRIEDNRVRFKSLALPDPKIELDCTDMMITNNTLFLKYNEKLMEIAFKVFNGTIHPIVKQIWKIEANSSQLFSNVVVQDVLGKKYLAIPLPQYDKSSFIVKPVHELDDYQIMDAKYENKICVLTGHRKGKYTRFVIIFDEKHNNYKIRIENDIDYSPINFTCLDNGVCVMITHDDAVEIFLNRIDKDDVKRIEDPVINSTMRLTHKGNQVLFFRDNKLYEIKMR